MLADGTQGVRARMGMRLVITRGDHCGVGMDGFQKQLAEVGRSVMARLGEVGGEDPPCFLDQALLVLDRTRGDLLAGVMREQVVLGRNIEVAPSMKLTLP